jgi:uncharacterized protein YprB with RNaseH-like and TPR domain
MSYRRGFVWRIIPQEKNNLRYHYECSPVLKEKFYGPFMRDLSALRARLRQAGLKPASELPPPAPKVHSIPEDWPGKAVSSPLGDYYLAEFRYAPGTLHGNRALMKFLDFTEIPDLMNLPSGTDPARMVFMDTETTGLAGGAGTLAFLVGVGFYAEGEFVLRQFFLPDPAGEAAMLEDSLEGMEQSSALVTFNGRAFDVPILQSRAGQRLRRFDALAQVPQLDLLQHARRLWRGRLESCSLRSLENELLDVRRASEDVPSSLIPEIYREYLMRGDARPLSGVFYHNIQDILSMAVLAAQIAERFSLPVGQIEDPLDALALAFIHRRLGRVEIAEEAFHAALKAGLETADRVRALEALGGLLKGRGASAEAVRLWEDWHLLATDDPTPCIELAKFYEWRARDLGEALRWSEAASAAATKMPDTPRRREVERAVAHRLKRLARKQKT